MASSQHISFPVLNTDCSDSSNPASSVLGYRIIRTYKKEVDAEELLRHIVQSHLYASFSEEGNDV